MNITELRTAFRTWADGDYPSENAMSMMELLNDPSPITADELIALGFTFDAEPPVACWACGDILVEGSGSSWAISGGMVSASVSTIGQLRGMIVFAGEQ